MKYIKIFLTLLFSLSIIVAVFLAMFNKTIPILSKHQSSTRAKDTIISRGNLPPIPFSIESGFTIHVFAENLHSPRTLLFTPGGTLLVSSPQDNAVYALTDRGNQGIADSVKQIISGENHVHGLAFYNNQLFIADVDKVVRYNWNEKDLIATKDKVLFPLPENSDHNNRSLLFDESGKLYVSLGSTCNVCRESPTVGGSVLVSDANGSAPKVYAIGLRNAAFLTVNPQTHDIWDTEMGRDNLGDNLPPDELNILHPGSNYGWPNCYGDKVHDDMFDTQHNSCTNTIPPIYQIPAHSAPLGLLFITSKQFPENEQGDLLIAYHGSWNRSVPTGYKVVRLHVSGNTIVGSSDFLTGFLPNFASNGPSDSLGRPVDLIFDTKGNLFLSDDKAGKIYIIQKSS